MTREDLRERISLLMGFPPNGSIVADEAIRLVVEACCAKADECLGGFTSIAAAEERGRVAGLMLAEEIVERAADAYGLMAELAAATDKQAEREFKMVASYLRNRVAEIHAALIGPRLTPPDDAPAAQRNIDAKETER